MPGQDALGFLQRGVDRRCNQVLPGHVLVNGPVQVLDKPHVAVGQDADQLALLGDRDARDVIARHQFFRLAQQRTGRQRDRVDNHARFRALDLVDLFGLVHGAHVAVDDPDAALSGQRDRQAGLGHGVHGRREDGDIEPQIPRQPRPQADLTRQDLAVPRRQQHIVERQCLWKTRLIHGNPLLK